MAEDRRTWSRRAVLAASAAGGASAVVSALTGNENGNLYGGKMALNEAYNVAENLWIGPDSAKGNVDAKSGRVYLASDTQVEYYGDSGSWTKLGVGSSSEPVPSVHTDETSIGGSAIAVSSGSATDLQTALNNYDAVRVVGTITVSDGTQITVPDNTTLWGHGMYDEPNDGTIGTIVGDGIRGNYDSRTNSSALIKMGNEAQVFGLGVINEHSGGDAIHCPDRIPTIAHCDIFAKDFGIQDFGGSGYVEPKIWYNRLTSHDAEDQGIAINTHTDGEFWNNVIRGFNEGIHLYDQSHRIVGNHTYKWPATAGDYGLFLGGNAKHVFVGFNDFEGDVQKAGIGVDNTKLAYTFIGNRIWGDDGTGSDGIRFTSSGTVKGAYIVFNEMLSGNGKLIAGNGNTFEQSQFVPNFNNGSYSVGARTENSGTASKSDGDTIAHGLNNTPGIENVHVTTASSNRAYVTSTDGTNITIALEDTSGTAVTTDETVYWEASL